MWSGNIVITDTRYERMWSENIVITDRVGKCRMSRGKCSCADARTANSAQGNDDVAYCPSAPAAAPDSSALSSASSLASAAADAALRSWCQRASCAAIDS